MKKIIFNHKSYLEYDEIIKYKKEIIKLIPKDYELIIFPQIIYLPLFKDSKLNVGAQNFYSYNEGSFTGETNIKALKSIDVNNVLLGHSERKELVNEKYELTRNKLFKSLNAKVNTILCIGELTKKTNAKKHLKKEIDFYTYGLEENNIKYLTLAYEPAWAVGGFESLEAKKIEDRITYIKKLINKKYKTEINVLYGGSVNKETIKEILEVSDGVLIGKSSSDINKAKELLNILK